MILPGCARRGCRNWGWPRPRPAFSSSKYPAGGPGGAKPPVVAGRNPHAAACIGDLQIAARPLTRMLRPEWRNGRRSGFKIRRRKACRFESDLGYHRKNSVLGPRSGRLTHCTTSCVFQLPSGRAGWTAITPIHGKAPGQAPCRLQIWLRSSGAEMRASRGAAPLLTGVMPRDQFRPSLSVKAPR